MVVFGISIANAKSSCSIKVSAPLYVHVEQDGSIKEFRLSTTDPATPLEEYGTPHGVAAISQCSGCFGAERANIALKLTAAAEAAELGNQPDVGTSYSTFLMSKNLPADRFYPLSPIEEVSFSGLAGTMRLFSQKDEDGHLEKHVINFFGSDDCIGVVGAVQLVNVQKLDVAIAEARRLVGSLDVSEVEVGSTSKTLGQPPPRLPRLTHRESDRPPPAFTMDEIRRSLN